MRKDIKYVLVLQCHIAKERCSGFFCEKAFHDRTDGFAEIPLDTKIRMLPMTCGGCCGRASLRKLSNAVKLLKKKEGIEKENIVIQLSSCITKHNYHAPPCPNLDYIKELISVLGVEIKEDTKISKTAQARREKGMYCSEEKQNAED